MHFHPSCRVRASSSSRSASVAPTRSSLRASKLQLIIQQLLSSVAGRQQTQHKVPWQTATRDLLAQEVSEASAALARCLDLAVLAPAPLASTLHAALVMLDLYYTVNQTS